MPIFVATTSDVSVICPTFRSSPSGVGCQELRHWLTASLPRGRTTVFNGSVVLRHCPRGLEVGGGAFAVRAVSRYGSASSMRNALQGLVWPLSAPVNPHTTRRHCTCHNRKHRHRYSFRHTCINSCSTFPFGPASPRPLVLLTLGLSPQ